MYVQNKGAIMKFKIINICRTFLASGFVVAVFATAGSAQAIERSASGVDAAAIQVAVDQFRGDLGANNGIGSSFVSGRREINWDGVPNGATAPNSIQADFFNFNRIRQAAFLFDSAISIRRIRTSSGRFRKSGYSQQHRRAMFSR
jgi:hypothetical protein